MQPGRDINKTSLASSWVVIGVPSHPIASFSNSSSTDNGGGDAPGARSLVRIPYSRALFIFLFSLARSLGRLAGAPLYYTHGSIALSRLTSSRTTSRRRRRRRLPLRPLLLLLQLVITPRPKP